MVAYIADTCIPNKINIRSLYYTLMLEQSSIQAQYPIWEISFESIHFFRPLQSKQFSAVLQGEWRRFHTPTRPLKKCPMVRSQLKQSFVDFSCSQTATISRRDFGRKQLRFLPIIVSGDTKGQQYKCMLRRETLQKHSAREIIEFTLPLFEGNATVGQLHLGVAHLEMGNAADSEQRVEVGGSRPKPIVSAGIWVATGQQMEIKQDEKLKSLLSRLIEYNAHLLKNTPRDNPLSNSHLSYSMSLPNNRFIKEFQSSNAWQENSFSLENSNFKIE